MIYFTSDTHFCHENIIRLTNRPFTSIHDMHSTLIKNWNYRITDSDEIYILGDFAYRGTAQAVNSILGGLSGKKYLIRGNHDQFLDEEDFNQTAFRWVKEYHVLRYNRRKFVLFHYPILEWDGFFSGAIHLYGHVHNSPLHMDEYGKNAVNVGVDVNDFAPVSADEIIKMVDE